MAARPDPLNRVLLPGPENAQSIVELADQAVFVGEDQFDTVGERNYLCCGCAKMLFRRFHPTKELRALAWRCECGQTNIFE